MNLAEKMKLAMNHLASGIEKVLSNAAEEKWCFVLIAFPKNGDLDAIDYISNAPKDRVKEIFRHRLDKWEQNRLEKDDDPVKTLN